MIIRRELLCALVLAACQSEAVAPPAAPAAGGAPAPAANGGAGSGAAGTRTQLTAGNPAALPNSTAGAPAAGAVAQPAEPTPAAGQGAVMQPSASDADGGTDPGSEPPASADAGEPTPAPCADCCPDGFPRGAVMPAARKWMALKPSAEGVAVCANGDVFLASDDGKIRRVPLGGQAPEPWASVGERQPAGVACDERGRLFVAIYSVRDGSAPTIMRIDDKDAMPVALPKPSESSLLSGYNGVVAIPGLGVYATDSAASWIVRYRESSAGMFSAEIVARDILLANGLAYDSGKRMLYVASSLSFAVYSFLVAENGSLSGKREVKTPASGFFDGVAVDEKGEVYAADYSGGALVRLSDGKSLAKITNPASLAFRGGTLLVTDYRLNEPDIEAGLYALELGVCGGLSLR